MNRIFNKISTRLLPKKVGNHIMLAAFPKSSSTFLMRMLAEHLNYKIRIFINANDGSEQEMYLPIVQKFAHENTVTHQHVRATPSNIKCFNDYNFKVFVLLRDLEEVIFSLRRHIYSQPNNWSIGFIKEDFFTLNEEQQYDFLIDMCLPWYFNFYGYWYSAINKNQIQAEFLTFKEITQNTNETINRILSKMGQESISEQEVQNLYHSVKDQSRITKEMEVTVPQDIYELNKGQKDKIKKMAGYFPSIDFTLIGL